MCYNGTFRFKKLDDSFWNGETFRFADYIIAIYYGTKFSTFFILVKGEGNCNICSQIYDTSVLSYIVLFILFKTRMLFVRTNCYFCITNG